MNTKRKTLAYLLAAIMASFSNPLHADDVKPGAGGKGKISLTVNFVVAPQGGEPRYQAICQDFAEALWVASEGTHYVGSMRFVFGTYPDARINWAYQNSGHSGLASFKNFLNMNENAGFSSQATADLLLHEFGHYFYGQSDEYQRVSWGVIGACVENDGLGTPDADRKPCDDWDPMSFISNDCGAGQYCAPGGRCTADLLTNCEDDGDCVGKGFCVLPNENGGPLSAPMGSAVNSVIMCDDQTETVAGEGSVSYTCNMANQVSYHRWCDIARHQHDAVVNSSTLDIEAIGENGNIYNCWDRAAARHPTDIGVFHTIGDPMNYSSTAALGAPIEPVDCIWAVDPVTADDHSVLLVDRSGSMGYVDFVGSVAVDSAADGALYFYNKTADNNYAGVYAYNTGMSTVEALDEKIADLNAINLNAGGNTNIGQAIAFAVDEFAMSAAPDENRNIVLFSDGKHNTGPEDPITEAAAACAAGINVHTIAYGDADSSSLQQIAQAPGCSGFAWMTGTESPLADQQNPHELKTSLARARYHLLTRQEVMEVREPVNFAVTTIKHELTVPKGSQVLDMAWLGNRARSGSMPTFAFNGLQFELISPSGLSFTPGAGAPELNGLYRALRVETPESGTWAARVTTTGVIPPVIGALEIAWLANVEHPDVRARAYVPEPRRALGQPVTVLATLAAEGFLSTGLDVEARITHAGHAWQLPMFDDGQHDDGAAGDGVYGAIFDPAALPNVTAGGYRVKVTLASTAGGTRAAAVDTPEDQPANLPVVPMGSFDAETMFRLSGRYTTRPDGSTAVGTISTRTQRLYTGMTSTVTANVTGLGLHPDNVRVGLGPGIQVDNIRLYCTSCPDLEGEQSSEITFDATVDAGASLESRSITIQVGLEALESTQKISVVAPR